MASEDHSPQSGRRSFFKQACSVVIGGVLGIVPVVSGLLVLLDPLRRKGAGGAAVHVANLSALPEDGRPVKFSVVAEKVDAWNRSLQAVGAVYLRREGATVRALNVVCPHAGCFVDHVPGTDGKRPGFLCPCHNSTFALDGKINDPRSPALRGLDELDVEVRKDGEVWVKFQNYRAGVKEKVAV